MRRLIYRIPPLALWFVLVGIIGLMPLQAQDDTSSEITTLEYLRQRATASDDAEFTLLVALLQGITPDFIDQFTFIDAPDHITFFAPTDDAIRDYIAQNDLTLDGLLTNTEGIQQGIRYHMLVERLSAADLMARNGDFLRTFLPWDDLLVTISDGRIFLDEAEVIIADIEVADGIIHVVNRIIIPDGLSASGTIGPLSGLPTVADFVLETATTTDTPDFTVLLLAMSQADTAAMRILSDNTDQITVFAPTDRAFAAAIASMDMTAQEFFARPDLLTGILQYHILDERLTASMLAAQDQWPTLAGDALNISVANNIVRINGQANSIITDIQTSNGIIHVIDRLLLPPSFANNTVQD